MPKNPVDPNSIEEVRAYEEAKEMLDLFVENNIQTFETYRNLVEELNIKRQAADKVVREKKVSCSDWDWYQTQITYDPEKLYEHMGRDEFLKVGGTLRTQTVYSIDKSRVEASISKGAIPKDVVEDIKKETAKYHAPKPIATA